MPRRSSYPQRLRNTDLSDRELLGVVDDLADNDGWASTEDIADRVFGTGGSQDRRLHSMRCVGIRFAWLARFGVVEKSGRVKPVSWRLTDLGLMFFVGAHPDRVERDIDKIADADMMHAAMAVGERYRYADPLVQTLMRRAIQHHTGR